MRQRMRVILGLALVVGLVAAIPGGWATAGGIVTFNVTLTGEAEVPGPGDPNGSGNATISVDPVEDDVCFDVSWTMIGRPLAAHIHRGGPNKAGPVRVELFAGDPLPRTIDAVSGCVRNVDPDVIDAILANPGRFYVNVHTRRYPDGAIRGQLETPV